MTTAFLNHTFRNTGAEFTHSGNAVRLLTVAAIGGGSSPPAAESLSLVIFGPILICEKENRRVVRAGSGPVTELIESAAISVSRQAVTASQ